ncbi:MAG: DUF1805 domain-containing protein [Candidatus Omnitrophica bacterium]|nr:DUF1805 domain-containing protein [Candidatus Omnitrophota bacterium]
MFTQRNIKLKNKDISGIEVNLHNANFVLAVAPKGYICCGYLNLETAQKLDDIACVVTGVKTIEDLLKADIVNMTHQAQALGIKRGMNAQEVLERYL